MAKETMPLSSLKGWDKNPRAIKKADFERLKRQIEKHGQFKPVIVTPDGEVIGGNMRLKAYKELGMNEVWVSVVDPKDETSVGSRFDGTKTKVTMGGYLFTVEGEHAVEVSKVKKPDVWRFDKPQRSLEHPTMKPIALCAKAIKDACPPGGSVLDPFSGSGSTLMACEQLGRSCYAMEMDPRYCDVIVKRWEQFTGGTAEKITGK